jgi:hypothetical protein
MTLNRFGLRFHHLGVAVGDPSAAMAFLAPLGYRQEPPVFDPLQRVHVSMCRHSSMPDVELVWPGEGPSPIDKLIRRDATVIYHWCYSTSDVDASLTAMIQAGLDIVEISPPLPALLFGGIEVSFYSISGFGLIEILHAGSLLPEMSDSTALSIPEPI